MQAVSSGPGIMAPDRPMTKALAKMADFRGTVRSNGFGEIISH
jgi:hypothetical protein